MATANLGAYRDALRIGRKPRLSEPERRTAWTIFEGVQATLKAQDLLMSAELFTRMATLAPGRSITHEALGGELSRLRTGWKTTEQAVGENGDETALLINTLGAEGAATLDLFDRAQLACVICVCRDSKTLSEAGRRLSAVTCGKRKVVNDADRLRKYLARFGLAWPCGHRSPL